MKNNTITTLKLEKETKERLEKLREHKRETYDDIIRKIMYVLNTVRDEPVKAKAILEFIDEKRKRMFETSFSASTNEKDQQRAGKREDFRGSQDRTFANERESSKRAEDKSQISIPQKKDKGSIQKHSMPNKTKK